MECLIVLYGRIEANDHYETSAPYPGNSQRAKINHLLGTRPQQVVDFIDIPKRHAVTDCTGTVLVRREKHTQGINPYKSVVSSCFRPVPAKSQCSSWVHFGGSSGLGLYMKNTNYFRNILLAFLLFFIGQVLVRQFENIGIGIILTGVIVFYIFWWRAYQKDKENQ